MTSQVDVPQSYPICDLFASIQGEATWAGRAMLFLRFSGCPLSCPWCDEPRHKDPNAVRSLTAHAILAELRQAEPTLSALLLTGGEPLAIPGLAQLVAFLKEQGYWLAMETSGVGGTIPPGLDWITLSPKTPLPESVFARANELKYVVGATPTARQSAEIQQRARSHGTVWVQPQADGTLNAAGQEQINPLALQQCLYHIKQSAGQIRLSLQTHKWVGLP
ncbi:MAG: 7-carboxy-7-deazaguanine synthase QueE [Magnetococcales bacterium]|nr:7-carboxy-7-deazaguanine synthase QueE [Magnetococcales bacterium]